MCLEAVPVKISGRNSAKEIVTHVSVNASSCFEGLVRELDLNDMKSTSVTWRRSIVKRKGPTLRFS